MMMAYNEAISAFGSTFNLGEDANVSAHLDGRARPTWRKVSGPTGAVLATLDRIEWNASPGTGGSTAGA